MLDNEAIEIVKETTSKGDSSANGLAEGAVKEVKAKVRTLRFAVERNLRQVIPDTAAVLAWLVAFAAFTINVTRVGTDGKTAFQLRYGRSFKRPLVGWGQKVQFQRVGKADSRVEATSRWDEGILLGMSIGGGGSSNYIIGQRSGIQAAKAIKPLAPSEQWDIELLLAIEALPWDKAEPRRPRVVPLLPAGPAPAELPPELPPRETERHRAYTSKRRVRQVWIDARLPWL